MPEIHSRPAWLWWFETPAAQATPYAVSCAGVANCDATLEAASEIPRTKSLALYTLLLLSPIKPSAIAIVFAVPSLMSATVVEKLMCENPTLFPESQTRFGPVLIQ